MINSRLTNIDTALWRIGIVLFCAVTIGSMPTAVFAKATAAEQAKAEWEHFITTKEKELRAKKALTAKEWEALLTALSVKLEAARKFRLYENDFIRVDHLCHTVLRQLPEQQATEKAVALAHMNLAIAKSGLEQGRAAWDQCDLAYRTLQKSDPILLVSLLTSLGVTFREAGYSSDALHAFYLAERLFQEDHIDESTQADFYNAACDAAFRCSDSRDDYRIAFNHYATKAIELDEKLGKTYELGQVTTLKYSQEHQDSGRRF